jgi:benzoyl-CoA reductase/2-hydroxyglutaryl-CoA dehydratase subunit BcrC/BadD/HgdB
VLTTVCDQMRRAADLAARLSDGPVFLMTVPSTWQTAASRLYYLDEVKRLGRFLQRLGGRSPSTDDLIRVMRQWEAGRAAIREARPQMTARRYSEAIAAFHRHGEVRLERTGETIRTEGVAVALAGGPMVAGDFELLDRIEGWGGRVVLDATESGERTWPAPFDPRGLADDPLAALAEAYFGNMPGLFRRPNTQLYEWLRRESGERGVRGVVVRRYVWCDGWHAESARLKEELGLPVVDVGDDDSIARGRTATRLQAFLEMRR